MSALPSTLQKGVPDSPVLTTLNVDPFKKRASNTMSV